MTRPGIKPRSSGPLANTLSNMPMSGNIHMLYTHLPYHNDSIIKTHAERRKKTSLEKYSPLTLLQGFERVVQGFACERVFETEHKLHILTSLL